MTNRIFYQSIETENNGMAGGTSFYDIEDLYQAFKERLLQEVQVASPELLNNAELVDVAET